MPTLQEMYEEAVEKEAASPLLAGEAIWSVEQIREHYDALKDIIPSMTREQLIHLEVSTRGAETAAWKTAVRVHAALFSQMQQEAKRTGKSVADGVLELSRELGIAGRTIYRDAKLYRLFFEKENIAIESAIGTLEKLQYLTEASYARDRQGDAPGSAARLLLVQMANEKAKSPAFSTGDANRMVRTWNDQVGLEAAAQDEDAETEGEAPAPPRADSEGGKFLPVPRELAELYEALYRAWELAKKDGAPKYAVGGGPDPWRVANLPPGVSCILVNPNGSTMTLSRDSFPPPEPKKTPETEDLGKQIEEFGKRVEEARKKAVEEARRLLNGEKAREEAGEGARKKWRKTIDGPGWVDWDGVEYRRADEGETHRVRVYVPRAVWEDYGSDSAATVTATARARECGLLTGRVLSTQRTYDQAQNCTVLTLTAKP